MNDLTPRPVSHAVRVLALLGLVAPEALAQSVPYPPPITFSIDGHGPTISAIDPFTGAFLTASDLLTPFNGGGPGVPGTPTYAAAQPGVFVSGGNGPAGGGLGLTGHAICAGLPPGTPCPNELDALSFGVDHRLPPVPLRAGTVWFSVDEFAVGSATVPDPLDLTSEGANGAQQAAGGVLLGDCRQGIAPLSQNAPPNGNNQGLDGDGLNILGNVQPGLGLVEPVPPGIPPNLGDNLDAFDIGTSATTFPRFFSLDGTFIDPLNGTPLYATAATQGFAGADVLVQLVGGGPPAVYASAAQLGLDILGAHTDDLDALALWENGNGVFEPSQEPYDWMLAAGSDMLLFSVRRGSAVVGAPDSRFGQAIEPGDILSTPISPANGGLSPFPSVFISAEAFEMATTRSLGVAHGDDLNGLDTALLKGGDCNGNCIPDSIDIEEGTLTDANDNGTPDECEAPPQGGFDCFCNAGAACGNDDGSGGCGNSSGVGAHIGVSGSASVTLDDLHLIMSNLPPNQFGIFYMGSNPISVPFGDGLRCIGGSVFRFPIVNSGPVGTATFGPIVGHSIANFGSPGAIGSGATWLFQGWYRDPNGPCGSGFNLTSRYFQTFQP